MSHDNASIASDPRSLGRPASPSRYPVDLLTPLQFCGPPSLMLQRRRERIGLCPGEKDGDCWQAGLFPPRIDLRRVFQFVDPRPLRPKVDLCSKALRLTFEDTNPVIDVGELPSGHAAERTRFIKERPAVAHEVWFAN
jgi:hypothetical protein